MAKTTRTAPTAAKPTAAPASEPAVAPAKRPRVPADSPYHPGILLDLQPTLLSGTAAYAVHHSRVAEGYVMPRSEAFRQLTGLAIKAIDAKTYKLQTAPDDDERLPRLWIRLSNENMSWIQTTAPTMRLTYSALIRDLIWTGLCLAGLATKDGPAKEA